MMVPSTYRSKSKLIVGLLLAVDAAFLQSCVQQKLDFQARVHDVLQGAVKPSELIGTHHCSHRLLTLCPPSDHPMLHSGTV